METVAGLETIFRNVQATRYLSAAGLVTLLYDHLLTFDDEVNYIWNARWAVPKVLFLITRYLVPASLIINTYQLSGISTRGLSDEFCRGWLATAIFLGVISVAISNFLVLLRLWILWNRSKRLVYWTFAIFTATQMTTIAISAITVSRFIPLLSYSENLHMCIEKKRTTLMGLWLPGITFECLVFMVTWWNALDRPRGAKTPLTTALYRDGVGYFVILTGLRVLNLVISIVAPLSLVFLGAFFIWSGTNLTVTRLILNVRKISAEEEETLTDEGELEDVDKEDVRTITGHTIRVLRRERQFFHEEYELN